MRIEKSLLLKSDFETAESIFEGQLGNRKVTPDYMNGVASTIAVIALGLLSSSSFRIGSLFGLADVVLKLGPILLFSDAKKDTSKFTDEILQDSAFDSCVLVPIVEEAIFRLGMQTCLQRLFAWALPHSMIFLPFGITMSSATVAAILVSSVVFGVVHLDNGHDLVVSQSIGAFFGGLIKGYLMETDGFIAACAAHIVNNSTAIIPIKICLAAFGLPESDSVDIQDKSPKEALVV
jgi:membrane protease YdiL (CAAX protease family)